MACPHVSRIQVREARPGDAELLIAGNLAMALETEGRRLDPATITAGVRAALADTSCGRYFVAEADGAPAGQAMITREWSDWRNGWFWWLQSVYVLPEYRRAGVFRSLYEHIRGEAHRAGNVCGLRLYVEKANAVAHRTYAALGMTASDYRLFEQDWSPRL